MTSSGVFLLTVFIELTDNFQGYYTGIGSIMRVNQYRLITLNNMGLVIEYIIQNSLFNNNNKMKQNKYLPFVKLVVQDLGCICICLNIDYSTNWMQFNKMQ